MQSRGRRKMVVEKSDTMTTKSKMANLPFSRVKFSSNKLTVNSEKY